MKISNYKNLICELPYQNQGFDIYKKNWRVTSQQQTIDKIFNGSDKITLNRFDIENSKDNLSDFILKTLMWGYPTKGRGKNIDTLLSKNSFKKLISTLSDYLDSEISIERIKSDIKNIDGLGLSTMSKFTNFLNTTINGNKAVILDEQIINAIKRGVFEEFNCLENLKYENAINKYDEYLSVVNTISEEINSEPDHIEIFLFLFGRSLTEIKIQEVAKKDFAFLDDFLESETTGNNIEYLDLFEYVVKNKTFKMELTEFLVIENGFREIWNTEVGEIVGDGQIKNYVYKYIEKKLENKTILEAMPQKDVDECVDLILEYMASIGQFYSDFSKS